MRLQPFLFTLALLAGPDVAASTSVPIKHVSLDDFMSHDLRVSIPLTLSVPTAYERVSLKQNANPDAFYWMMQADAARTDRTGDLPATHGFMHAEISMNVGYDESKDLFVGVENPDAAERKQVESTFSNVQLQRCHAGRYPILLLDMKARADDRHLRAMYVATLISTNAVYIDYIAPEKHDEIGDFVWNDMRASLKCDRPKTP